MDRGSHVSQSAISPAAGHYIVGVRSHQSGARLNFYQRVPDVPFAGVTISSVAGLGQRRHVACRLVDWLHHAARFFTGRINFVGGVARAGLGWCRTLGWTRNLFSECAGAGKSPGITEPTKPLKTYDREIKTSAVKMLRHSGKPMTQIARELGCSTNALTDWTREYDNPLGAA